MRRKLRAGAGVKVSTAGKGPARSAPPILGALEELAIGCLAGVVAKGIVSPLSMVTVRMQTSKKKKEEVEGGQKGDKTLVDEGGVESRKAARDADSDSESEDGSYGGSPSALKIAKEIYDEQGLAGFWSGFSSTIILVRLFALFPLSFVLSLHPLADPQPRHHLLHLRLPPPRPHSRPTPRAPPPLPNLPLRRYRLRHRLCAMLPSHPRQDEAAIPLADGEGALLVAS